MADDPTTATTDTVDDATTEAVDDTATVEDDAPLGPKGEKALEALKEERRKLKADLAQRDAELEELRRAQMDDNEKAIDDARRAARSEALSEVHGRLFKAELRAATAATLRPEAQADLLVKPEVALALLGLDEYPVTSDGDIDSEAISQAVASYVEARPHLAASATQTPGSVDLGARTTPPPKTIVDAIAEAEQAEDWRRATHLKLQQFAALPRP